MLKDFGLEPLPVFKETAIRPNAEHPFILQTGTRIPMAIHTRLHKVSWARALRTAPSADISLEDAKDLSLIRGDEVTLSNENGSITVKVNPTAMVKKGEIYLYHGYEEADASRLLYKDVFDPYSGFPSFKSARCNMTKI